MSTKEQIHSEIEKAREEDLDELYRVIRNFNSARGQSQHAPGALGKLKRIQVEGPEDFAANLDL
jgi:hypothetical protein